MISYSDCFSELQVCAVTLKNLQKASGCVFIAEASLQTDSQFLINKLSNQLEQQADCKCNQFGCVLFLKSCQIENFLMVV